MSQEKDHMNECFQIEYLFIFYLIFKSKKYYKNLYFYLYI